MGSSFSVTEVGVMAVPIALGSETILIFLCASLVVLGIFKTMQKAAEYIESVKDQCETCQVGTKPPCGTIVTFSDSHLLNRKRFGGAVTVDKTDYPVLERLIRSVPCDEAVSVPVGCARKLRDVDGGNKWSYTIGYTTLKSGQTTVLQAWKKPI
jgi:hypothetical protein